MAVLTPLTLADVAPLCAAHGLASNGALEGVAGGSVNSNFALVAGGTRYFLRLYEEQDLGGAAREVALLERLAEGGVLTPRPLRPRDGAGVTEIHGKPAALFPWVEGDIRCQAGVTAIDARRVGEALGMTHLAARGVVAVPGRFEAADLARRLEGVARGGDAVHAPAVPRRLAQLAQAQAERLPGLPRGLIHGDLFRDNVLWSPGGDLAALLDFESACDGTYAYDLAVTLLAWCFGDDLEPRLVRAMVDGYESVRPLAPVERAGLHAEARFAALRFLVTRVTDYALRTGAAGPRVVKDWRRFEQRLEALEAMGPEGLGEMTGV